jgi:hypothetical protein
MVLTTRAVLAPWLYRSVLSSNGPLASIGSRQVADLQNGQHQWQSLASLKGNLRPSWLTPNEFYSDADGCGTAPDQFSSRMIAISEAIERWCFYATVDKAFSDPSDPFGFRINRSTTGLAFFPSIRKGPARARALAEAVERLELLNWSTGRKEAISAKPGHFGLAPDKIQSLDLLPGAFKHVVAVISLPANLRGLTAYGFAAATDVNEAIRRALIEAERNQSVLEQMDMNLPGSDEIEKRLKHWCQPDGLKRFLGFSRQHPGRAGDISSELKGSLTEGEDTLLIDAEIKGPWSNYGVAWRCLFRGQDDRLIDDPNTFYL